MDGSGCSLTFFDGPVFEQGLRERVYEHFGLSERDVDLVFTQGASVLECGDVVDPARGVSAVKRSVEDAAGCGIGVAHPCRLAPCCQQHRWFKSVRRQCFAIVARLRCLVTSV